MTAENQIKYNQMFGSMFPQLAERQKAELRQKQALIDAMSGKANYTFPYEMDANQMRAIAESESLQGASGDTLYGTMTYLDQPVKQIPTLITKDEYDWKIKGYPSDVEPEPIIKYAIDPIKPSTTPVIVIDKGSDEQIKILSVPTVTTASGTPTGGIKVGLGAGGPAPQTQDDTEDGAETQAKTDSKTKYILYALAGFGIALAIGIALFFILKSE